MRPGRPTKSATRGFIIPIGGAENRVQNPVILRRFVKLVPNASRKHSAVFYVVIGEPSGGTSLGRVTRAAIVLPAQ